MNPKNIMKITFSNLINLEEAEIGFVLIPTIIFDKYGTNCDIHITWLCFSLDIEL